MCTLSVSNVIYHKFSHGADFYTLNGKNVNVMLEFKFQFFFVNVFIKILFCIEITTDKPIHAPSGHMA